MTSGVGRLADTLHFSFTVSDLERSVSWYTTVLGLELVARQRSDSDYIRTLVGYPDAVLDVAQFRIPGVSPGRSTHMLELIQYLAPTGATRDLEMSSVGAAHLGFLVDDIDAEYRRLIGLGVVFVNPPVTISAGVNRGGAAAYFRDPDGITLELLMAPRPTGERAR